MPPRAGAGVRFSALVPNSVNVTVPATPATSTFEAWVRPAAAVGADVMEIGGSVLAHGVATWFAQLQVGGPPSNPNVSAGSVLVGQWQHIVLVLTATTMALFVDGVQVGANSWVGTVVATSLLRIGRSFYYGGSGDAIAGVRHYSRALTADEVARRARGEEIDRTGLVVDLPMDEGQGVRALDRSAVPLYDGILTNGPMWTQPKAARGYLFGAADNQTVDTSIVVPGGPFTVVGWQRRPTTRGVAPNADLGAVTTLSGATGWNISGTAGQLAFRSGAGGGAVLAGDQGADPFHFAGVYDGTTMRLFRDGVERASAVQSVPAPVAGLRIGSYYAASTTNSVNGHVWDVAVFTRALTSAEIRALMLGTVRPDQFPECIAWFPLEGDTLNRAPVGDRLRNMLARSGWGLDGGVGWATPDGGNDELLTVTTPAPALTLRRRVNPGTAIASSAYAGVQMPVTPGQLVTVSADAATLTGQDVAGCFVQARFAGSGSVFSGAAATVRGTEWSRLSVTFVVPTGATTMSAWFQAPLATTAIVVAVRRWTVREGASAEFVPATELEPAPALHGREVNGPRLVRPRARDGVVQVGAAANYVTLPAAVATAFNAAGDRTLAAWVRQGFHAGGHGHVFGAATSASIFINPAGDSFDYYVGTDSGGTQPLGLGWRLAVMTITGTLVKGYRDGVLDYSYTATRALNGAFTIGSSGWFQRQGYVGPCRWWDRALTDDEVAALMVDVVPRYGLQGEWLTDGSIMGAVALDTSGKGNHGTLLGAVAA